MTIFKLDKLNYMNGFSRTSLSNIAEGFLNLPPFDESKEYSIIKTNPQATSIDYLPHLVEEYATINIVVNFSNEVKERLQKEGEEY